jgi:glucose-6-phosphate isomerase
MGINPLNQPGVEEGKILTYALLGRKGFEKEGKDGESLSKDNKKYIQ